MAVKFSEYYLESSEIVKEANAAVFDVKHFVKDMCISDLLPKAINVVYVNITTFEGKDYCLELTAKGWRISSFLRDCMQGDVAYVDVHATYFENIYSLLNEVSPLYRKSCKKHMYMRLKHLNNAVGMPIKEGTNVEMEILPLDDIEWDDEKKTEPRRSN